MSSPFSVTTTTNSVRLDQKRQGEVSFTVFNASGRALRARARVVAENPEAEAWLTLDGAAERALSIAGTDQYTVQIAAPSDAAPGSYPFRLDVLSVENPDRDYVQGPTVTFGVPKQEPKKKRLPIWLPLAMVGVLLLGGLGYLVWPRSNLVELPSVNGQPEEAARQSLERACAPVPCFQLSTRSQPDEDVSAGHVIATEPEGRAERGATVTLMISSGPAQVEIPPVQNDTLIVGVQKINASGLHVNPEAILQSHSSVARDNLIGTQPGAGEFVPRGSEVQLIVSTGPSQFPCQPWPRCIVLDDRFLEFEPRPNIRADDIVRLQGNQTILQLDQLNIPEFNVLPDR